MMKHQHPTKGTSEVRTTGTAHHLSWDQALGWRMARHHLVERAAPSEIVRVASDISGLHAQVTSSSELSLWARIDRLERATVNDVLWADRALVKLWAMRGTLYMLPAAELGVWFSALGTYRKFGNVGNSEIDALADAVDRTLKGRILTREELAAGVEQRTGSKSFGELVRFSWGSYLKAASFRGLICFAPREGARVTFTSPETWVPHHIDRIDPVEALREITRRFLAAYAPATTESLTRWWLGPPTPRRGEQMLKALGKEAVEVNVDGQRAWALARDIRDMQSSNAPDTARLLPAFDPWVIGASRRAPLLEPQHQSRIFRKQGWVSPVLIVNGRIVGVWRHERKGRRLIVEMESFGRLPAWAHAQLDAEAERLATFLDCRLERR
jgi:uncharacterized protein YcaQ